MAEQPYQVTLKAGEGFAAPWLIINADNGQQLDERLDAVIEHRVLEKISEAAGVFATSYGLSPSTQAPAAASQQGAPPPPAPASSPRGGGGRGGYGGGRGGGGGPRPASEKAVGFMNTLREERGLEPTGQGWTAQQVSDEIDRLKAMPRTDGGGKGNGAWG